MHCAENKSNTQSTNFILECSLITDTQLCFTLHFTLLGISFSPFLPQPFAFLILETVILGHLK